MSDNTDEDEGPYAFSDYVPAQLFPTDSHPNPHEDTGQPHIEVNPLVVSTMGLEALHSRIRHQSLDAASCGTSHSAQGHAMREARLAAVWCGGPGGRLRIGGGTSMELAALPLLGRRYRALRLLGEGTFAQILECEDTLAPLRHQTSSYTADYGRHFSDAHGSSSIGIGSGRRRVAVKVLRAGFAELGRREARALAAVQFSRNVSTSLNGSSGSSCSAGPENELWSMGGSSAATGLPVLGLRGTFHFLGHFAVVLDLAAGSLLDVAFGGYPLGGHTRTPWRVVDPRAGIFPPPPPPTNDSVSRNAPENTQNSNYGADDCRQSTHGAMSSSSGDNNGNGEDSAESSFTAREQWDARVQARKSSRVLPPQVPHTPAHVVLAIAAHLLTALARLKALGIVHADLKPENVLLVPTASRAETQRQSESIGSDSGGGFGAPAGLCDGLPFVPVLADFGNALHADSEGPLYEQATAPAANATATTNTAANSVANHARTNDHCTEHVASALSFECQTLAYRAPEVLLGLPGAVACAADAWSLGVLLAELWLGLPLFRQAAEAAEDEDRNRAMAGTSGSSSTGSTKDFRSGDGDYDNVEFKQRVRRARRARALMVCDIEALLGPLHRSTFNRGRFYSSVFGENSKRSAKLNEGNEGNNDSVPEVEANNGRNDNNDDNVNGTGLDVSMSGVHRRSLKHVKRVSELLRTKQGPAPPLLVSLLSGLLCPDPQQRLTPLQALRHPALQSVGGGCAIPYAALAAAERAEAAVVAAVAAEDEMNAATALQEGSTKSGRRTQATADATTCATAEEPPLPVSSGSELTQSATEVGADGVSSSKTRRRHSSGRIKLVGRREREAAARAQNQVGATTAVSQSSAGELGLSPETITNAMAALEKADPVSFVNAAIPQPVLSSACSPVPAAQPSVDAGLARSPSRQSRIKLIRHTDRAPERTPIAVDVATSAIPVAPTPDNASNALTKCNVVSAAAAVTTATTATRSVEASKSPLAAVGDETESDSERVETSATIFNVDDSDDEAAADLQIVEEVAPSASQKLRSIRSNAFNKASKVSSVSVLLKNGARSKKIESARTQTSRSRRVIRDNTVAPNSLMALVNSNYDRDSCDNSSDETDSASDDGESSESVNAYTYGQKKNGSSDQGHNGGSSQGSRRLLEHPASDFKPSVGSYVIVAPRSGPGENHPGGVALVTALHRIIVPNRDTAEHLASSTKHASNEPAIVVDVRYVLSRRCEAGLPLTLLKAHDPLASTPKRQRLRSTLSNLAGELTSSEIKSSAVVPSSTISSDRRDDSGYSSRKEGTTPLSGTPTPLPYITSDLAAVHGLVDSPVTDSRTKRRRLLRDSSDSKSRNINSSSDSSDSGSTGGISSNSISSRADAAWGGHALSPSRAKTNGLASGRSLYGSPSHQARSSKAKDSAV